MRKQPIWALVLTAIVAAILYWGGLATDRYVSRAHVVLLSAEISQPRAGLAAILPGPGGNDLLMLRDYMLSTDMLAQLDAALHLRDHYSSETIDWLSRLSSPRVATEEFHRYFLSRVSVVLDEYAQVLRIGAQAYDPATARRIVELMLDLGEAHMNAMGHRLAEEQVSFIEVQVTELRERMVKASNQLLSYQNTHGLVSPTGTVESVSSVIAGLENELAKLEARKAALSASQSESSPEMMRLSSEIRGMRRQIDVERSRLARSSGDALNRLSAEYELLRLQSEFASELYSTALTALETTRVEAARSLKQVSILQAPTNPEYPTRPRRVYNITVFALMSVLAGLILHLLLAIIRDHKD
nr:chain-length determining protein [Thiorhodococcus minor]